MATSNDPPPIVSSRVPFKWEEAAGKPIGVAPMPSSSPDMLAFSPTTLQLPPRLEFPLHRTPLSLQHSPCERPPGLHHTSHLSLQTRHSPSPNHHTLKRLYANMLKPASWSQPLHSLTQSSPSRSGSAFAITDAKHDDLTIHQRFFFDKALPKQFKYSVSMPDSWKAQLPIHQEYKRQDALVHSKALSFLAMEEHETDSNASSPLHPILFHERHGFACPWQPIPIKTSKGLGEDDGDDDEGFHDFFSTTSSSSSVGKPLQTTNNSIVSSCPLPSPWFLEFGPEKHKVHEIRERSNLVVRLVAIVKLKNMISSKVCKLRKRREGANQQANHTSMWSPTLATYLYNEQKEERESGCTTLTNHEPSEEHETSEDEDGDGDDKDDDDEDNDDGNDDDNELLSMSSAASSHRFRINPHYHPPSSILRTHLQSDNDLFKSEGSSSFRVQFSQDDDDNEEQQQQQEEELLQTFSHRLSLREQLAEFDDEYPFPFVPNNQSLAPQNLDSQQRELTPCKGMCKVRNTVKVLVATIKLILVQPEDGKRKGQRPSLKYGGCFKPTLSAFPSTHNQTLYKKD